MTQFHCVMFRGCAEGSVDWLTLCEIKRRNLVSRLVAGMPKGSHGLIGQALASPGCASGSQVLTEHS